MNNLPAVLFSGEKLTRWLRFKTRTKKRSPSAGKQAIGFLLIGIGAVSVALVMGTGLFVVIAPNFPASVSTLAQSEQAANLSAMALRNVLPGQDVRIERLFAYNLKLYVDRQPFDDIPHPDRKPIMAKIGRLWCDNIGYHWLATVSVVDIRSGKRLFTHVCAFGKLQEVFS